MKTENTGKKIGKMEYLNNRQTSVLMNKYKGGSNKPENLQWGCHRCNKLKGNKLSNNDVRRQLSLPENFDDIMEFRNKGKTKTLLPTKKQSNPIKTFTVYSFNKTDYQSLESWVKVTRIENLCQHR